MFKHPSPYLLLTLTSLFWAGNYVIARATYTEIPPVALAFWRWSIALLLILPFIIRPVWQQYQLYLQNWQRVMLLALLGIAGFNTFVYLGVQYTTATNALLLNSFIPVVTLLLTWVFQGQKLSFIQGIGVTVSVLGVATIVTRGDFGQFAALQFNKGDLLVMVAVLFWALYTTILKGLPAQIQRIGFMGVITFIGVMMLLPFYLWEISTGRSFSLSMTTLLTLGYVGLFPSVLALLFYNRGVAEVGPGRASLFIHLMPVFGTIMAILFLGETVHLFQFFGISLIFSGIYLSIRVQKS